MTKRLNNLEKNELEATKKILTQFKEATESTGINEVTSQDFKNWLESRRKIGENYLKFLASLNLNIDNPFCAEVGKTWYDSLVLPYRTSIITPYTEGLDINSSRIIPGRFKVISGLPFLEQEDEKQLMIPNIFLNNYITQNPYSSLDILDWEDLHNSGLARIIVGYYGKIFDKDKEEKLKQLIELKKRLTCDYIFEYDEDGDTYYSVVASNGKNKCKIKNVK